MLMSYVADGTYYCRGTFQVLADALVAALVARGGELTLRSPVRRILVEDGRAAGVVLENGQRVRARLVISNADARQTVEELVGAEHFPRRYRAAARGGERIDLGVRRLRGDLARPRARRSSRTRPSSMRGPTTTRPSRARPPALPAWLSITAPSLLDPALAPAGEHLLVLTTLDRAGRRRALARRQASPRSGRCLRRAERAAARSRGRAALRRERDAAHLRALHAEPAPARSTAST